MVMPAKRKFIIAIAALILFSTALFLLLSGSGQRAVENGADIYINAMRDRDFNKVFDFHAPSQRRVALSSKTPGAIESQLTDIKMIYNDQLAAFEQAEPTTNLIHAWAEKFLLIKDMSYKIMSVNMKEDIDNPSLPLKKTTVAYVEIAVEYTNKDTAPDLDGKVKKATYILKIIHSRNLARIWEEKSQKNRWLFDRISVKSGSSEYWQ